MTKITADTILATVATKSEALEIARDRRATLVVLEAKYGAFAPEIAGFNASYDDLIDAIAEKFGKVA